MEPTIDVCRRIARSVWDHRQMRGVVMAQRPVEGIARILFKVMTGEDFEPPDDPQVDTPDET